jgi:YspA, cpYpsA-related SLOG family
MRTLVCGGRTFWDPELVFRTLDGLDPPITAIIEGGQWGADSLARTWAYRHGMRPETYEANWEDLSHPDAVIRRWSSGARYDAMAGPRRNQRMLVEGKPDRVIAFPGGRGTADIVAKARAAGVPVIEVEASQLPSTAHGWDPAQESSEAYVRRMRSEWPERA